MMPAVSIIVPVYNVAPFLHRCIDSVLAQTFTDFELLLIDDGSKDTSGKICDEYATKDARVTVFHKENGGVSSARNVGLDHAKGEWIAFVDADDYYIDNDCIRKLYSKAKTHNLDILRGEYQPVDDKGKIIAHRDLSGKRFVGEIMLPDRFLVDVIHGEFFLVLMLIRSSRLNGLRFSIHKVFLEDMYFAMQLFQQDLRCEYMPLIFYAYRKIESSASNIPRIQNLRDSFDMCDTFASLAESCHSELMRTYCRHRSVMMYYWTLQTLARREYSSSRNDIIALLCLNKLQKRTFMRALKYRIINFYMPFIVLSPLKGCKLLFLKDHIIEKYHFLLRTYRHG